MKNSLLMAVLLMSSTFAFADAPKKSNISPNMKAEKCVLVKSTQAPGNDYDALIGVNAINIFAEWTIWQIGDNHGNFPARETLITLSFNSEKEAGFPDQAVGDSYYQTLQTTKFTDIKGNVIDNINTNDEAFRTVYTHSFEKKTSGRTIKLTAAHSAVISAGNYYSKDVIVNFEQVDSSSNSPKKTVKGSFVFKCNDFDQASKF